MKSNKLNEAMTSCHNVRAKIYSGGEGTSHYYCPICDESVNIDGSNPNTPPTNKATDLRKAVEKKIRYVAYHGTTLTAEGMVNKATEDLLEIIANQVAEAEQRGRDRECYENLQKIEALGASEDLTRAVSTIARPLQLGGDYEATLKPDQSSNKKERD